MVYDILIWIDMIEVGVLVDIPTKYASKWKIRQQKFQNLLLKQNTARIFQNFWSIAGGQLIFHVFLGLTDIVQSHT